MEHSFREWDSSNDPIEVTEKQLRTTTTTNRLMSDERQQQQKFSKTETEDEMMLLGGEDDFVEHEKMDDDMEEQLLGTSSVVGNCTEKTTSVTNRNKEKSGNTEKAKESMFGAKYGENFKRFKLNLYGVPSDGPIKFGGGIDLSLLSNKSEESIKSSGTSKSDGKAKAKKTVTTKRIVGKRILKRKTTTEKSPTNSIKNLGGRNGAIRMYKQRSKSLDTKSRDKWNTSSSFLDVTSSTDCSSFFDERKMSRPLPFYAQQSGNSSSILFNPKNSKPNTSKFSFTSSTEQMMAEWIKSKSNARNKAKVDKEKDDKSSESDNTGGEESTDEQQSDAGETESDEGQMNFLGLLKHKERPKSKQHGTNKQQTSSNRSISRRFSSASADSETSPKFHKAPSSPYYKEFSPRTTLFVCPVPLNLDENGLKSYFLCFGNIRSVFVPLNPSNGEHRGFGFVDFVNERSANAAYAKKGMIFPRGSLKPFNLTWYRPNWYRPNQQSFSSPTCNSEIRVTELSQKCTEQALLLYFGHYGCIVKAQIERTTEGNRAALIRFADQRSAARAIEVNPKQCKWAKTEAETREQQDGSPSIFDLSKSVANENKSPPFRPSHRSQDAPPPTLQKQFFPDPIQKKKSRSHSLGRFLSNGDKFNNYSPENKAPNFRRDYNDAPKHSRDTRRLKEEILAQPDDYKQENILQLKKQVDMLEAELAQHKAILLSIAAPPANASSSLPNTPPTKPRAEGRRRHFHVLASPTSTTNCF